MKRFFSIAVAVLAAGSSMVARAQEQVMVIEEPAGGTSYLLDETVSDVPRVWAGLDYLLWFVKSAPLPVPVATRTTAAGQNPTIGLPGTEILYGGGDVGFPALSGVRSNIGAWLGGDGQLGLEVSGFALEQKANGFYSAAPPGSNVAYGFPFLNGNTESVLAISGGTFIGGGILAQNTLQLWGVGANALYNLQRTSNWELTAIGGFQHLNLSERFALTGTSLINVPQVFTGTFNQSDSFQARNQFYGANLGGKLTRTSGPVSVSLLAQVALGTNYEVVNVNGVNVGTVNNAPPVVTPGGIYAQSTNIGRYERDRFCAVPGINLTAGYEFLPGLRGTIGYSFMYMSDVARPGDQIDRVFITGSRPTMPFQHTDFFAHGLNFGLLYQY